MKLFQYTKRTKRTKRIIIVLMIINSIAFLTSTFNISPKIVTDKQRFFASESWYFIFNDGDCYITVD